MPVSISIRFYQYSPTNFARALDFPLKMERQWFCSAPRSTRGTVELRLVPASKGRVVGWGAVPQARLGEQTFSSSENEFVSSFLAPPLGYYPYH